MKNNISLFNRFIVFALSFIFTKGTVYFVPLLLADILSTNDYGVLEYALAGLGFVITALLNMGIPSGYPYFILRLKDKGVLNGFKLHPIWLISLFIINQIVYYIFNFKIELYLAFNIAYIIATQELYSIKLKSQEKPSKAIFLDSGVYIVLLAMLILYKLQLFKITVSSISIFIFLYALVYVLVGVYGFFESQKDRIIKNYKKILGYSINVMIGTFLIFLITYSGRILAEYYFGFEEVAVYSFYFRLAAIVVMIYQMVNIMFFKKIYTVDPKILDNYYSIFFASIFLLSYSFYFISPYLMDRLSMFFTETYNENKGLYFLLSGQMVMWIASALNSNIVDRENLAKYNNFRFIGLLLIGLGCLHALNKTLNLELMVYIHYTVISLACFIQYYSLKQKNIKFKKSFTILATSYISVSLYYFVYFN